METPVHSWDPARSLWVGFLIYETNTICARKRTWPYHLHQRIRMAVYLKIDDALQPRNVIFPSLLSLLTLVRFRTIAWAAAASAASTRSKGDARNGEGQPSLSRWHEMLLYRR